LDYLTTHTSLSPIRRGCTRLAAASDKVYQLRAHGRWFSPGTPASSITKTGRHDIAEILLKVALNTKNQSNQSSSAAFNMNKKFNFDSLYAFNEIHREKISYTFMSDNDRQTPL
jgi:hypothetical protein